LASGLAIDAPRAIRPWGLRSAGAAQRLRRHLLAQSLTVHCWKTYARQSEPDTTQGNLPPVLQST